MLAIVALWALAVVGHQRRESQPDLLGYQVSAFDAFNPVEQGIYADLAVAGQEISARFRESGKFMSVDELAEDSLPPFDMTAAAVRRGSPTWSLVEFVSRDRHVAAYVGSTS